MSSPLNPSRPILRRTVLATGGLAVAGCVGLDDEDTERAADDEETDPTNDDSVDNETADDDADDTEAEQPDEIAVEIVTEELVQPWGMAFLPEDPRMLVTELEGRLNLLEDGTVERIDGTPDVFVSGQGGLLDVALDPGFPEAAWVYLTYAASNDDGQPATHLGRGRLDLDDLAIEAFEVLHVAEPFDDSRQHFGSRVVFGPDGMVYVTSGDRGSKDFGPDHVSQDTSNDLGATLRLTPDGSIPDDNPFLDDADASDAIYSYGHRNAQGMTVHPETGEIWQSEHGEQDGDAINIIEAGGNYGWPIAHAGCTYSDGDPIGDDPFEREDVVDPVHVWECNTGGFPPAGTTFYDGDAFSAWQGDLFVGGLASEYLARFTVDGREVEEAEPLLVDEGWRIRDVAVQPETGHLFAAVDADPGPIVRLTPG